MKPDSNILGYKSVSLLTGCTSLNDRSENDIRVYLFVDEILQLKLKSDVVITKRDNMKIQSMSMQKSGIELLINHISKTESLRWCGFLIHSY